MSATPQVSVLLPFRDAADTLEEALAGLLAEDVDLEVVAIDDGSVDEGARIAAARSRVRVVSSGGVGIAGALTTGLHASQGRYVARMDADDISLPGRIAAQVARLDAEQDLDVIGCRIEAFPLSAVQGGMARYLEWQNALLTPADHSRELFVEAPLCHPAVTMRRATLERVGGWRDLDWPEDYDLWLRIDAAGGRMAKLDQCLFRWRQGEGRLTFTDPRYALERHRALKATFLAPRLQRAARALVLWGAGPTGRRLARALEPQGVRFARFIDIDPRKIGREARGVPIVHADTLDPARDFVVIAVGSAHARGLVRAELVRRGFLEGRGFLAAA